MSHSHNDFMHRHIGPGVAEQSKILQSVGVSSLDELINQTIPADIRLTQDLDVCTRMSESEYLTHIRQLAAKNKLNKNYIGFGYYGTFTPAVIRRNIFENPGWYTQYTPYQAEIAQGRLEALLNFQTMIADLTGFPVANASLLDEGTAAAEAISMFYHVRNKRAVEANKVFVSELCLPQTIDVIKTRMGILEIDVEVGNHEKFEPNSSYFAVVLQYPAANGEVFDYTSFIEKCTQNQVYSIIAADILALSLLKAPADLGADCAVGNTQRFGVPMGYGGPHAAYFATKEDYARVIPGRIIGISVDRNNHPALRMALQTREQHIRREKATSNICTAQALLAIMAGMYACHHGPKGIKEIASKVHRQSLSLKNALSSLGIHAANNHTFDTLSFTVFTPNQIAAIKNLSEAKNMNFAYWNNAVYVSLDETTEDADLLQIANVFAEALGLTPLSEVNLEQEGKIPASLQRTSAYLTHPVFNENHNETRLMRYIKSLEEKDLSLTKAMIPLGSCTMKLNAAAELEPLSLPEFANMHPFAPTNQAMGYQEMVCQLSGFLNKITGFDACSLQPNSGAQGEYTGILVIRAYQKSIGQAHRNIMLIPASAHGTNPATAVMTGCKVVVVACDEAGNIDLNDLESKASQYKNDLCGLMVTYPSTHGVFEEGIKTACNIIHENGGQVYMDGANMNAQVGLTNPGLIGADVCHLNLHKTFAIPHGGGGPGMGPICVKTHLAAFLPGNPFVKSGGEKAIHAVSSAPYGSASILLISYAYIKMLGSKGLTQSTKMAILNANYIKSRLETQYEILYVGKEHGRVAHELIVDFRSFKHSLGIEVEDVAKRLIDYGFHAPTVSFPVAGTLMIEPTESEDLKELDRFCDALLQIRKEIAEIENGTADKENNVLKNAPHTLYDVTADEWNFPYSRQKAAYPLEAVKTHKFWPAVARVNNSHGDRNLICTCPPIEAYQEEVVAG